MAGVAFGWCQCQKLLNLRVVKLIYAQCNNLDNVNKIHYKNISPEVRLGGVASLTRCLIVFCQFEIKIVCYTHPHLAIHTHTHTLVWV